MCFIIKAVITPIAIIPARILNRGVALIPPTVTKPLGMLLMLPKENALIVKARAPTLQSLGL